MSIDVAAVVQGYVESLLWSESCNGTAPTVGGHVHRTTDPNDCDASFQYIGYTADDLADDARQEIEREIADFVTANAAEIGQLIDTRRCDETDIGHNFLLSRNGHGTGFWDRGWGDLGERLHRAAKPYGTTNAYAGANDKIYVQ